MNYSKTTQEAPQEREYWTIDIQFTNANSWSFMAYPNKKPPTKPEYQGRGLWRQFTSGSLTVTVVGVVNPKWSDDIYLGLIKYWRRGNWRKVDLRRKADKS